MFSFIVWLLASSLTVEHIQKRKKINKIVVIIEIQPMSTNFHEQIYIWSLNGSFFVRRPWYIDDKSKTTTIKYRRWMNNQMLMIDVDKMELNEANKRYQNNKMNGSAQWSALITVKWGLKFKQRYQNIFQINWVMFIFIVNALHCFKRNLVWKCSLWWV